MQVEDDLKDYLANFDAVDNALQMRTLVRWNGRNLRTKENLAEHTHLVIVCLYELVDKVRKIKPLCIDMEILTRYAMFHDSLELLRGDILSITKDKIPGLREYTDKEENVFLNAVAGIRVDETEHALLTLADLIAC